MSKHIGIVACSAEGAALCYRTICIEAPPKFGTHNHPEITMHTFPLAKYMEFASAGKWDCVGQLMLESAAKLAAAGADFLICPDNTIHQGLDLVRNQSPRPWLHIAEVVAREAAARGYRHVGLTGTYLLMNGPVYPDKFQQAGIALRLPSRDDQAEINRAIFDELVNGVLRPETAAFFQRVIDSFRKEGCDAVILGCTEIPLIVTPEISSLPTLDSTRLLACAALEHAAV